MPLAFIGSERMTLGVELELQLVDARTRDLQRAAPRIFEALGGDHPRIKPEFFESMVELNTGICSCVGEARADIERSLGDLQAVCSSLGVDLASAGSHPFARYEDRVVSESPRFAELIDRNRWIAQRLMIFGLHVHVGVRDGDHAIGTINGMLPFLPHLLALSASSPFWQGFDTGLASSRITLFEALPTAGHPIAFADWSHFERFYEAALRSRAITSHKDLWWDIRPSPEYGTVEVRVCDALPTVSELMSVVTLVHLLCRWIDERFREGERFVAPHEWLIRENKWRASRWGLEADLVLDESGRTGRLRDEVARLVERLEGLAATTAESRGLDTARDMLEREPSHRRQRAAFRRTGMLRSVAEALVTELRTDVPIL